MIEFHFDPIHPKVRKNVPANDEKRWKQDRGSLMVAVCGEIIARLRCGADAVAICREGCDSTGDAWTSTERDVYDELRRLNVVKCICVRGAPAEVTAAAVRQAEIGRTDRGPDVRGGLEDVAPADDPKRLQIGERRAPAGRVRRPRDALVAAIPGRVAARRRQHHCRGFTELAIQREPRRRRGDALGSR